MPVQPEQTRRVCPSTTVAGTEFVMVGSEKTSLVPYPSGVGVPYGAGVPVRTSRGGLRKTIRNKESAGPELHGGS